MFGSIANRSTGESAQEDNCMVAFLSNDCLFSLPSFCYTAKRLRKGVMDFMGKPKEQSLFWQRSFGWRAGSRYIAPSASAADVIRYEQEELGNTLDVPPFLLTELDRAQYM